MIINISRVHFPVTVLGPGRRLGIWLQGCSIGCEGCVSRDTWDPLGGRQVLVEELVRESRKLAGETIDGITITGGEPFDQPEALAALLVALTEWRAGAAFDVLCYSGYPLKQLRQQHGAILERLDALIPEPFADRRPTDRAWRGSANQPLVPLSDRGRARYADPAAGAPRMQVSVTDNTIWLIGIPKRRDMQAVRDLVSERGLDLGAVSWNS